MDPDPPVDPVDTPPGAPAAPSAPAGVTAPDAVPTAGPGAPARNVPIPQLVTELRDLVVTYVRQETLVPLQSVGRYVGFGVAGSLLLGLGVLFLALSGLRALQTETGETFTGNWSWVPYVIMVFVLVLGAALVWMARNARRAEKGSR